MLDELPQPVIFGHRGAPAFAPENTLASFKLAADLGAPAIELDVKLTADRQVVVLHDPTLDRTTSGHGPLADHTLAQVKGLDAGSWFSAAFEGEPVPTLEEVFEAVGQRVRINVELTNYTSLLDDLADRVVGIVRENGMEDRVLFSSFNPLNLIRARRLVPHIPLGLLAEHGRGGMLSRGLAGEMIPHQAFHPSLRDLSPEMVNAVHARGRRVFVWTVNEPDDMRRLFSIGVDGIFTDNPKLGLQAAADFHNTGHSIE